MAFAFARAYPAGFPFDGNDCFMRHSFGPGSCRASARASASAGPCRGRQTSCGFGFGDASSRDFEVVDTPESYLVYFDTSGFQRGDLKVWVSEGTLFFRASSSPNNVVEKRWVLPKNVLQDGVSAKLDEGKSELTVSLLKVPPEEKAVFDVPIEHGESKAAGAGAQEASGDRVNGLAGQPNINDDVDGSWVEVADTDVTQAKAKGKSPSDSSVLQEAEAKQSDSD